MTVVGGGKSSTETNVKSEKPPASSDTFETLKRRFKYKTTTTLKLDDNRGLNHGQKNETEQFNLSLCRQNVFTLTVINRCLLSKF